MLHGYVSTFRVFLRVASNWFSLGHASSCRESECTSLLSRWLATLRCRNELERTCVCSEILPNGQHGFVPKAPTYLSCVTHQSTTGLGSVLLYANSARSTQEGHTAHNEHLCTLGEHTAQWFLPGLLKNQPRRARSRSPLPTGTSRHEASFSGKQGPPQISKR